MLVKIGSASNSCQQSEPRRPSRPAAIPCTELERHAGIWRFDAGRAGPAFADGQRLGHGHAERRGARGAAGLGRGLGRDPRPRSAGRQLGVQRRGQREQSRPRSWCRCPRATTIGWPYCYYSNDAKKKVLAPEYGGDGKTVGRCAKAKAPAIAFPGHWAPMALAFYPGTRSGPAYTGGLFVSFHGSWNRAPLPQEGYRVVFAPFANGKPTGKYETFATDARGPSSGPVGLAVGKDGALFLSADENRTIWRIVKR